MHSVSYEILKVRNALNWFLGKKLKASECYIHFITEEMIYIVDPITLTYVNFAVEYDINQFADSISMGLRIFIMGGFNPLTDLNYRVKADTNEIHQKAPMLYKKMCQSLCAFRQYIYSIGGYDGKFVTNCMRYDTRLNKWINIANMNAPRGYVAAFVFKVSYIYAVAGRSDSDNVQICERLKLNSLVEWESCSIVNVKDHGLQGIQIGEKSVLIFGGSMSTLSYIMSIENKLFEEVDSIYLDKQAYMYACPCPVLYKGQVFAFDHSQNLHIYTLESKSWQSMPILN